jgi:hypothetical protein
MVNVSFDFDDTLSKESVQKYAKELMEYGINVYVTTTRYDDLHKHRYEWNPTNEDLWKVIDELGIPRHYVRFTCMEWKYKYLDRSSFIWHLDDNKEEEDRATFHKCSVPIVRVDRTQWKRQCNKLIENALNAIMNGDNKE